MNIFLLDDNPVTNAKYYTDKHVVKMVLEHAQMLSAAVRLSGIDAGYRLTHKNHPCTKWVCESLDNWCYLFVLTEALHDEWKFRFNHNHNHKSFDMVRSLPVPNLPRLGMTSFAQAMPDQYKNDNAVEAYREYYRGEKQHLFKWTKRDVPEWL